MAAAVSEESDSQREARARNLAFEQGRREAVIDSRLNAHDDRFRLINGSIEKHAQNAEALRKSVDAQGDKIDSVITELAKNSAVQSALAAKQISSRGFYWSTAGVILALLGVIGTLLEVVHV